MPPQVQPTNAVPLVTRAQMVGLRERHEVVVVTVAGPDPAELDAVKALAAEGVEVHAVRRTDPVGLRRWQRRVRLVGGMLRGRDPFRTIWYRSVYVQQILDRLLAKQAFDIVTVEDNAMGIYRYRTAAPLLLTEHEVRRPRPVDWRGWQQDGVRQWAWNEWDWQHWDGYQRRVWSGFDRIQVFTQRDATALTAIAPECAGRVHVNPFGIEMPLAADPQDEVPDTIVFSGGFSHQPNVDAALWLGREIMPQLRMLHPTVRLTIVGSYPPPEVQALACGDITVTGRVAAVEPYIERASVVVAPIRIGGGMRVKVLQGLGMGKAVVTTPLGADGLQNVGSPPLVVAHDSHAFASAIADLLAHPVDRHAMGVRGRAFVVEHFSSQAYARRLESFYEQVHAEKEKVSQY